MSRPPKYWRHIKTGNIYVYLMEVTNATNGGNDGQQMMIYQSHEGRKFAREKQEFLKKFEPVE